MISEIQITKRFYLSRQIDESGISGEGIVADGVLFSCGYVILCWRLATKVGINTIGWYPNIESVEKIHGHAGATKVVWVD